MFEAVAPNNNDTAVPAAYFESLDEQPSEPWPEYLNLQGVNEFDPNDPLYYAIEHCLEPRVKNTRWVNDNSVNLQYYSAEDAAIALAALTDPQAGDPASIAPQTGRKARPYSKQPGILLSVRQANSGDSKPKGAANRSHYYKQNPDVRGDRGERNDRSREHRRRQPPRRDFLDYDDMDTGETARRRYITSFVKHAPQTYLCRVRVCVWRGHRAASDITQVMLTGILFSITVCGLIR